MADGYRWWKLWDLTLSDPDLSNLSLEDFGRWVKLGILTKVHGERGVLRVASPYELLRVTLRLESAKEVENCLIRLPGLEVSPTASHVTIKWLNWRKYQESDSTERMRRKRIRDASHRDVTVTGRGEQRRAEEKREERSLVGDSAPTVAGPASPKTAAKKNPGKTDPNTKVLIEAYHQAFLDRFGSPPPIPGAKYGALAKTIIRGRSLEEAVKLVRNFFDDPPEFYREKNLFGLEHVVSAMNSLIARRASPGVGVDVRGQPLRLLNKTPEDNSRGA